MRPVSVSLKLLLRRLTSVFRRPTDFFLSSCRGVIHVGANYGQERYYYGAYHLPVLWIEPIPEIFEGLHRNISVYPEQRALNALVTDTDGQEYTFHVSNNEGLSSSILDLAEHRELWPHVEYDRVLKLRGVTLPSLLRKQNIDPSQYDALILDTQGSELLVLKGALPLLDNFRFVQTEVADFHAYKGCCQFPDLNEFLSEHGFKLSLKRPFAAKTGTGSYYTVVYERPCKMP